jgi:hypothetical protein
MKLIRTEDLRTRFQQGGADATPSSPEAFYKIQQEEFQRVSKIVKDLGLKPQ